MLKRAVAALVLAVISVVSVAYAAVRVQRDEAVTQRNRAVEAEAKCVLEGPGGRQRVEVESARDSRGLAVTLIDAAGFEANQRALDRERAGDL